MSAPAHIAVSGLIGAGKSTLVRGLAPLLDALPLVERFEDNPYFNRFYADPSAWAFQHFMFFYEQSVSDAVKARASCTTVLQERAMDEHVQVFGREFHSRGYLADEDLDLLLRFAETLDEVVGRPDLLLYVEAPVDLALQRLRGRGNAAETAIDASYLEALEARLENFVENWSGGPVVRLRSESYDFRRREDLDDVVRVVREGLGEGEVDTRASDRPARRREEHPRS